MTEPFSDIPALMRRRRHLGRQPQADRPALTCYDGRTIVGRMRHGELVEQVARVADHLRGELGIRQGDRIGVLSHNRLEVPVLLLAAMSLGAAIVPLNPTAAAEDWKYILSHSGARVVFASKDLLGALGPARDAVRALPIEMLAQAVLPQKAGARPEGAGADMLAEQLAVVLYTSGTTGDPKGVALSQRNLLANAWSMAQNFGLDGATQFAVLPLYHAHAFGFGLMTALLTGGHLVFADRLDPFAWAEIIRAESVSVTSVVPTLLPLLLQGQVRHAQVPGLRGILVSSAPLSTDLARRFQEQSGIPLFQGWGLSEYTNFACCQRPGADPEELREEEFGWEVPSVGSPLPGTQVHVLAQNGGLAPEGVPGELCVRGESLMLGYYRDPLATAGAIVDGWLRTGDEGLYHMHRGRPIFFITGRITEIIIRGGDKYSPPAIERKLAGALPALEGRLVVLGFPHRVHGEEIGAYLDSAALPDDPALRERVEQRLMQAILALPPAERPKIVLRGRGPIPRTHTGKIQRRRLQGLFAEYQDCKGMALLV